MNNHQQNIARHALGLDGKRTRSYRNYYTTPPDCPDHAEWMKLVADGDAECFDKRAIMGGCDLFKLTFQGARKALLPAETLDHEDFPNDKLD
jgi:hypothetical protein